MFKKQNYKVVIQKRTYDCGVAAVYALLLNCGVKVDYKSLENKLKLTKDGVSYKEIEKYLKTFKQLKPRIKENSQIKDLANELKKGKLVLVAYQTWGKPWEIEALECGHYSIAVRMTKTKVYLLDPGTHKDWGDGTGWRIMNLKDFENKWIDKDFGKIVKGWMLSVKPLEV